MEAPTGGAYFVRDVYGNRFDHRDIEAAHILIELAYQDELPPLHEKHGAIQMMDGSRHAHITSGNGNEDPIDERLQSPLPNSNNEKKKQKRKRGAIQMMDGSRHAHITSGNGNEDPIDERLQSPLPNSNNEKKKQKRKRGDEATLSEVKYDYHVVFLHQEAREAPTGGTCFVRDVYGNRFDLRDIEAAHILIELAYQDELPPLHEKHGAIQMMDGSRHADITSGNGSEDPIGERLQSPLPNSNDEKKKQKRKRGDEATLSEINNHSVKAAEDDTVPVENSANTQVTVNTPAHTGFSFSLLHLLSAVRRALINKSANDYDTSSADNHPGEQTNKNIMPSLTVHEIVELVRITPGDPKILQTKEPLQDLVRGVLKMFSSGKAILGVKDWKALVNYDKPSKRWSWVGPVSYDDRIQEEVSFEAWGIPHRTLLKLIDYFANWLRQEQETLQLIGTLSPPPVLLIRQSDPEERFTRVKTLKNPKTIGPSSEEVKNYFRMEESLRYKIPYRAFHYTAVDGRKRTVAPLLRLHGKPYVKARFQCLLKETRPPHCTVRSLVRDAAARLPGGIGTRSDICTLVRDSQFITEHMSAEQIYQSVGGALDRLQSELDPCVQFDREKNLWVYLHGERGDADFDDHGPRSRKSGRRYEETQT